VTEDQRRPSHGGNEAEIFFIAILGGKEIFLVHTYIGTVSLPSQEEKKCLYDESSM